MSYNTILSKKTVRHGRHIEPAESGIRLVSN